MIAIERERDELYLFDKKPWRGLPNADREKRRRERKETASKESCEERRVVY